LTRQGYDPAAGAPGEARECLGVPTHCSYNRHEKCHLVPAHCPCNQGENTMLADSEMTRWSGRVAASPHRCSVIYIYIPNPADREVLL